MYNTLRACLLRTFFPILSKFSHDLSFNITFMICSFQVRDSTIHITRNFVFLTCGISSLPKLIWRFVVSPCFWPNNMHIDLITFSLSLFERNQSCSMVRSISMQEHMYLIFEWVMYNIVSSTNCMPDRKTRWFCRLLQKIRNIKGPRQDPWGVPNSTG